MTRPPSGLTLAASLSLLVAATSDRALTSGHLVANGTALTVTTAHSTASFVRADLVAFQNQLTGEVYLRHASSGQLATVDTITPTGQALQASNWSIGAEPGTGVPMATITLNDSVRTLTLTVKVDPLTEEIVVRTTAAASTPGLRGASWSLAGLDLSEGRLIVPADTGVAFDAVHPGVGTVLEYPSNWHAQMAVYEAAQGSLVLYSTDLLMAFKQLRLTTRGETTIDVEVRTQAVGPLPSATAVPPVEWRLKSFAGDWRAAAQPYRDWLVAARPPVSNAAHPWVSEIRTVAGIRAVDTNLLAPLAAILVPSQTLLYVHDWRVDPFDVNFPDYTPRAGVAAFVTAAHALGFKVMIHLNHHGVSPLNADYSSVQAFHVRDPETLQLVGWNWHLPPSTPNRYGTISPASAAFRALWIARVSAAVAALQPDALHLDISGPMNNDGNGPIEGRTFPAGSDKFHQDIVAAFPTLALGGEGENDITYRYHAFAQAWGPWAVGLGSAGIGHPIAAFLFAPHVQFYGHLGQPAAADPAFKAHFVDTQRRGILPQLPAVYPTDLNMADPDISRLATMLQSWQTNAFQFANGSWNGALVRYEGLGGAVAELTDSQDVIAVTAAGVPLVRLAHAVNQSVTPLTIRGWPAFDPSTLYGLDPANLYWLDPTPRPSSTHVTALPPGIRLGPSTMVGQSFAHVEVASPVTSSFQAEDDLVRAHSGVRFQGVDTPLGNGAVVAPASIVAGGELRSGLFVHPPYFSQTGGETFVEYQVPIPAGAMLQFAVGVADDATCTDGVTFRVTANGAQLWSAHFVRDGWHEQTLSLAALAGTTAALRIISHPGPADNAGCDWSLWNGVRMTLAPAASAISVPGGTSVGAPGGAFSLAITTPMACPWLAVSSVPWITFPAGASGSGGAALNYAVAPNWGAARTGAIVIAGQTFTVTQSSGSANLIQNGGFDSGLSGWLTYATPDPSYLVASVVGGVLEFYRQPPPPGTSNQATVFQVTGVPVARAGGLEARFDLGNSSTSRKRVSVLILDSNFSDLSVCTF